MDKSTIDKNADYQEDTHRSMMNTSTMSLKANFPNPSITRKRKGVEPIIITHKVQEEEEKPIKTEINVLLKK